MPQLTSPINKALVLRGVVPATFPMLLGRVLYEQVQHVKLCVPEATPVKVRVRVVQSNFSGLLHFEYQLSMLDSDYDNSIRMSLGFFGSGVKVAFADFRIDGPGTMPPNYFESSADEIAAFRFDYGLSVGRDSRLCTLATTAREYKETGGTLKLVTGNTHAKVDVPAPTTLGTLKLMPHRAELEAVKYESAEGATHNSLGRSEAKSQGNAE